MERKNVFCCSCFIDQSVWFIDNSYHSWQFDSFVYKNGLISDKVFVYDKTFVINSNDDNIEYFTTIIVCCLECFEFILRFYLVKKRSFVCLMKLTVGMCMKRPFVLTRQFTLVMTVFNLTLQSQMIVIVGRLEKNWRNTLLNFLKQNLVLHHWKSTTINIFVTVVKNFLKGFF